MISLTIVCHCLDKPSCRNGYCSYVMRPCGQNNSTFESDNRPDPGIEKYINESDNKHFLCRAGVTIHPSLQTPSTSLALLHSVSVNLSFSSSLLNFRG